MTTARYVLTASALLLLLGLTPRPVDAACVCQCVDGRVTPICQSAIDRKPICAPQICPIVPPSIKPIMPPTIPPIGAKDCEMKQVWNAKSYQYEWRKICRT